MTKKGARKPYQKPYNREFDRSPIFQFTNSGTIVAGATHLIDIHSDNTKTKKYGAFSNLRITNNSDEDIMMYINQNRNKGIFIASKSIIEMDANVLGGGVISFIVENLHATTTISANEIRTEVWKEGVTTDSTVKEAHKLLHSAFRMLGRA